MQHRRNRLADSNEWWRLGQRFADLGIHYISNTGTIQLLTTTTILCPIQIKDKLKVQVNGDSLDHGILTQE